MIAICRKLQRLFAPKTPSEALPAKIEATPPTARERVAKMLPDLDNSQVDFVVWRIYCSYFESFESYDYNPTHYNRYLLIKQLEELSQQTDLAGMRQFMLRIIQDESHLATMLDTIMTTNPQFEPYRDLYRKLLVLA